MNNQDKKVIEMCNFLLAADTMAEHIVSIVDEILDNKWQKDTALGLTFTVGDILHVKGFYTMPWIISELANMLIGRTVRGVFLANNMDLQSTRSMKLVSEILVAHEGAENLIAAKSIEILIAKHGIPIVIDQESMDNIQRKNDLYIRDMIGSHNK